jgi:hypothetical protein
MGNGRLGFGPASNQWVERALSPGVTWLGHETNHSSLSFAKVKNGGAIHALLHTYSWRSASVIIVSLSLKLYPAGRNTSSVCHRWKDCPWDKGTCIMPPVYEQIWIVPFSFNRWWMQHSYKEGILSIPWFGVCVRYDGKQEKNTCTIKDVQV